MIPKYIIEITYFLCPSIQDNNNKLNLSFVIKIISLCDKYIIISITLEAQVDVLQSENEYKIYRSVDSALVSCFCFIIVAVVTVLKAGSIVFCLFYCYLEGYQVIHVRC